MNADTTIACQYSLFEKVGQLFPLLFKPLLVLQHLSNLGNVGQSLLATRDERLFAPSAGQNCAIATGGGGGGFGQLARFPLSAAVASNAMSCGGIKTSSSASSAAAAALLFPRLDLDFLLKGLVDGRVDD